MTYQPSELWVWVCPFELPSSQLPYSISYLTHSLSSFSVSPIHSRLRLFFPLHIPVLQTCPLSSSFRLRYLLVSSTLWKSTSFSPSRILPFILSTTIKYKRKSVYADLNRPGKEAKDPTSDSIHGMVYHFFIGPFSRLTYRVTDGHTERKGDKQACLQSRKATTVWVKTANRPAFYLLRQI